MSEKLLPKVNFVSRDLVQLKLEKKMLQASLKINQGKMDKVGGIMNRKLVRKGQDKVDPATTLNARGKPLSDYIVPRNKIRVPVEELSITVAKARSSCSRRQTLCMTVSTRFTSPRLCVPFQAQPTGRANLHLRWKCCD